MMGVLVLLKLNHWFGIKREKKNCRLTAGSIFNIFLTLIQKMLIHIHLLYQHLIKVFVYQNLILTKTLPGNK